MRRLRGLVVGCLGGLVLATSCNMPQPPIPTKLGALDTGVERVAQLAHAASVLTAR